MDFNEIFILLLIAIIVLLFIKSESKCKEHFEVDEDMNLSQELGIADRCQFSLECCPSAYSNDKGCLCMNKKKEEILTSRGYNRVNVDGFGY
jgi:hypothetical protein